MLPRNHFVPKLSREQIRRRPLKERSARNQLIGDVLARVESLAEPDPEHEPSGVLDHAQDVVADVGLHKVAERDVVNEERDAADLEPPVAGLPGLPT